MRCKLKQRSASHTDWLCPSGSLNSTGLKPAQMPSTAPGEGNSAFVEMHTDLSRLRTSSGDGPADIPWLRLGDQRSHVPGIGSTWGGCTHTQLNRVWCSEVRAGSLGPPPSSREIILPPRADQQPATGPPLRSEFGGCAAARVPRQHQLQPTSFPLEEVNLPLSFVRAVHFSHFRKNQWLHCFDA